VLVDLLRELAGDAERVLYSKIRSVLIKQDPSVYERAGVKKFKQYIKLAVRAGVVIKGGKGARRWLSLLLPIGNADSFASAVVESNSVFSSSDLSNLPSLAPTFPSPTTDATTNSLPKTQTDPLGQTCSPESTPDTQHNWPTVSPEESPVNANPHFMPYEFATLAQMIKEHHGDRVTVLSQTIRHKFHLRDAFAYQRTGVKTFNQYVSLAVQAGVVIAGGISDGRWMCLHPSYHATSVTTPRLVQPTSAPVEPCYPEISSLICYPLPEISGEGIPSNAPMVSPVITLTAILDAAQQTHSNSRPGAVPHEFAPLVEVLSKLEGEGSTLRFLRETVRVALVARDPQAFRRAGVKKFKAYLRLAVAMKLVKLEGHGDGMWISLHPWLR
jgi:hypothetical protein